MMPAISLCHECYRRGWVTKQDYEDDVELSEVWPQSLRNIYYVVSDAAVRATRQSKLAKWFFLPTAYCYIHAINGVQEKNYKLLYWIPFLIGLIPGFIGASILNLLGY